MIIGTVRTVLSHSAFAKSSPSPSGAMADGCAFFLESGLVETRILFSIRVLRFDVCGPIYGNFRSKPVSRPSVHTGRENEGETKDSVLHTDSWG